MPWRNAVEALPDLRRPVVRMIGDRKGVAPTRGLPIDEYELPDQVVERRPDVVDGIAEDHTQSERRLLFDDGVDEVIAAIRIEIGDGERDRLTFRLKEHVYFPLKEVEMYVCPRELGSDAVK
jgi:hypothetical protein